MIRVRHLTLPSGLSAFVRKAANGDLEVFVSDTLEPERARAAVKMALRTFRPASQRAGLLPVPVALVLAGGRTWLRALFRTLHAHLAASAATSAPQPGPAHRSAATAGNRGSARASAAPAVAKSPAPARVQPSSAAASSAPVPQPFASSAPAPSPSASSDGGGGVCVVLLGLKVCL
jgi:hypothetical protein